MVLFQFQVLLVPCFVEYELIVSLSEGDVMVFVRLCDGIHGEDLLLKVVSFALKIRDDALLYLLR